ncbi:MAG: FumA C-terminus/TtdB family hydratase beta subunit [Clostridia bacterium]|nr:FumA C-terminus/TtdB family hydratase beta subunit [Clostridia bacterium]
MSNDLLLPLQDFGILQKFHAGDRAKLHGRCYTARDAAHARLAAMLEKGQPLPVDLQGAGIYYCGPCPAPPGRVIGACGPTTSGRMDIYTPLLLRQGVKVLIGKGPRSPAVHDALAENGAVYLAAWGGAGALLARHVTACRVAAFEDLGPEAIYELALDGFPAIVAGDCFGGDVYLAH